MTTIYHFAAPVKSARRFGAGLTRYVPTYRADHSASDEAWLIQDNIRREAAHFDRMAEEAAAMDLYERGLL